MNTTAEAAAFLRSRDHYVILTHRRPDGDTVGSAAALCRILRSLGKDASILQNPELTPRYAPLWTELATSAVSENTCLISVDVASEDMLLKGAEALYGRISLALDHHESNPGYAGLNCVRSDFAAAGELIYELSLALDVKLDAKAAEALYIAVSTDTGGFRYSNVTAHTFRVAAACCEAGADIFPINRALFTVKSPARIRLESFLGSTVQFFAGGKVGLCRLTRDDMARLGATEDDVDDLSGFARTIEGVEIAIFIRDLADGTGKISLRTGEDYNAATICKMLGGGGHSAAAGASVPGGADAAEHAILDALAKCGVQL